MRVVGSLLFWGFVVVSSILLFPVAVVLWAVTAPFDRRRRALHLFTCFWASLYTWLNQICVNHCFSLVRKRKRLVATEAEDLERGRVREEDLADATWIVERFHVTASQVRTAAEAALAASPSGSRG